MLHRKPSDGAESKCQDYTNDVASETPKERCQRPSLQAGMNENRSRPTSLSLVVVLQTLASPPRVPVANLGHSGATLTVRASTVSSTVTAFSRSSASHTLAATAMVFTYSPGRLISHLCPSAICHRRIASCVWPKTCFPSGWKVTVHTAPEPVSRTTFALWSD